MYIPTHFNEPDIAVMHELIRARPLATLVTQSANGLNANHIPFVLQSAPLPFGTLQGHVARANPVLQDLQNNSDVLLVFHGPDSYISPSWYASKKETGKVVPTWNYVVVHAQGKMLVKDDAQWLQAQLEALTSHNEASFDEPWAVTDAPQDYTEKLLQHIVGIEVVITKLSGKWKLSQNQPDKNRESVIAGLREGNHADSLAIAELVADASNE